MVLIRSMRHGEVLGAWGSMAGAEGPGDGQCKAYCLVLSIDLYLVLTVTREASRNCEVALLFLASLPRQGSTPRPNSQVTLKDNRFVESAYTKQ